MKKSPLLLSAIALLALSACFGPKKGSNTSSGSNSQTSGSQTSGSQTSSSGGEDPNKYSFKQIDKLLANVVSASSLGIKSPKKSSGTKNRVDDTTEETQNLWVKESTVYDSSEPSVNPDGTINVTFTKTVTTQTMDEVTITKTIRLLPSEFTVVKLLEDATGIVIETEENREFRVVSGTAVLLDWTKGTAEQVEIDEQMKDGVRLSFNTSSQYVIETRLINQGYSFQALEGDKYSLKVKGSSNNLFTDVIDNQTGDSNEVVGMITFGGLTEGVDYTLTQVGTRYTETVNQSDVNGAIDKMYVLGQYTFVSFVPSDQPSPRPSNDQLRFNAFGVSNYDDVYYYSDNTRQSFVVDNQTGLVYKIENFRIKKIENNLIYSMDDNCVYDLKINENNELVFYTLFSNSSVNVYNVFKDKYGHSFIQNDKLNTYDAAHDVTYYVFEKGNSTSKRNVTYYLTSKKETIKIEYNSSNNWIQNVGVIDKNGDLSDITTDDTFDIHFDLKSADCNPLDFAIGMENGILKTDRNLPYVGNDSWKETVDPADRGYYDIDACRFGTWILFQTYDCVNNRRIQIWTPTDTIFHNDKLLIDYGTVLVHMNGNLYAVYDFHSSMNKHGIADAEAKMEEHKGTGSESWYDTIDKCWDSSINYSSSEELLTYLNHPTFRYECLLEGCDIDTSTGKIINYGLSGNTYYDYAIKTDENGLFKVEVFEEGTRTEEEKTVILQPINA